MPICMMQWMFTRASAADSCSLVMVAAKYFLSLRNMLCHRSSSADVICNVLEIHSNLNKFGKTMAKPSTALLERSFSSVLSHLRRILRAESPSIFLDKSRRGRTYLGRSKETLLAGYLCRQQKSSPMKIQGHWCLAFWAWYWVAFM